MFMPSVVALSIIIGLLRGGSLRHFGQLQLRWIPLVGASFGLQLLIFTPLRATPLIAVATTQLYVLSMLMLIMWVAVNWHIPGMVFMAAGLLLNTIAIVANGGYMPVLPASAAYAGKIENYATEGLAVANNSLATDAQVRVWLLTDILALPRWFPLANVFSIGDVLILVGACILCYITVRRAPRAPVAPDPARA